MLKMLSMVSRPESCGGLAGGEAKRAACSRVRRGCDGCDESQVRGEGSSMAAKSAEAQLASKPVGARDRAESTASNCDKLAQWRLVILCCC